MSNVHGFDFLRTEHTLDDEGRAKRSNDATIAPSLSSVPSGPIPMDVENKPDLEKQFVILAFLQNHRGSGPLPPNVIYQKTGIDLDLDSNVNVVQMLQKNPKVRVELVPDPENPALTVATYAYQAKFSAVRDRTTLLAQINRMTSGCPMRDLLDSYHNVKEDLDALVTAGDVIAVNNTESRDKILFPRGEAFLVELDGFVSLPQPHAAAGSLKNGDKLKPSPNSGNSMPDSANGQHHANMKPPPPGSSQSSMMDGAAAAAAAEAASLKRKFSEQHFIVETDMDPRTQIRRGEAVQVGGQWFRVSSAVKEGVPLKDQPARAQAPLSVVSLVDLSNRNEVEGYIRPLSSKQLPLDAPLAQVSIQNLQAAQEARELLLKLSHGRSGGIASQLLGSQAHAANPKTLAKQLASSSGSTFMRKRPKPSSSRDSQQNQQQQQQQHQKQVPKDTLAKAAADPALALYSHPRRHGCTRDVRDMYLATRKLVPEADHDLQQLLLQHKLLEPGEQMRRARLAKTPNVDNDGKPKKRRYYERKNQRMTNTHLEGTEIGAVLARAAEKQKQGKSVGDGGM